MSTIKFNVIFDGKIVDGFTTTGVKENLARMFKLSGEKVEQLFSRPHVVLKAGVDRQTAAKYLTVLAKAGAVITIEEQPSEGPVAAAASPPAPATPAVKNAGPVWGRKFEGQATDPAPGTGPGHGEYGSLERGMAGDYRFTIRDILSEAWQKVSGNKGMILLAYLIYFAIMVGVNIGAALIRGLLTVVAGSTGTMAGDILAMVLQIVATAPLMTGLVMLGVRISVDAPARAGSVLDYYNRIWPLLLTIILMYVMILLGFLLLILPGIYLSFSYFLALPLVADKELTPWQALEASRKAITHRWFSVFGLFFIFGLLFILGAIPMLIGLIWVVPLGLIAAGIIYRNIFGVSSIAAGS